MSAATMTPYVRLELRRTLRNPRAVLLTAAIPVMMYLLFSSSTPDRGDTVLSVHRAVLASMVAYGAIGGALLASGPPLAAERSTGWLRQLAATPLPSNAAVIAKLVVCLTLAACGSAIVGVIGALNGAELGAGRLLLLIVAMTLGSLSFGMLGLAFGASIRRPETAQGATILTYLSMSALGGLWVPTDRLPGVLHDLSTILPSQHLLRIGNAVVDGSALPLGSVAVLAGWTLLFGLLARMAWERGTRVR